MCQGFSNFSGFSHYIVLAKLATSSIRVNPFTLREAKTGLMNLEIVYLQKHFLENVGRRNFDQNVTTLLQIFCELSLYSLVI